MEKELKERLWEMHTRYLKNPWIEHKSLLFGGFVVCSTLGMLLAFIPPHGWWSILAGLLYLFLVYGYLTMCIRDRFYREALERAWRPLKHRSIRLGKGSAADEKEREMLRGEKLPEILLQP